MAEHPGAAFAVEVLPRRPAPFASMCMPPLRIPPCPRTKGRAEGRYVAHFARFPFFVLQGCLGSSHRTCLHKGHDPPLIIIVFVSYCTHPALTFSLVELANHLRLNITFFVIIPRFKS